MAMWISFVDAFTCLKNKQKNWGIFRVHVIEATLTCIFVPCLALQITEKWFSKFVGNRVEPSDVFLALTVDQGYNVENAIEALNVPVLVCNAHRLNTVVCWLLGIAGTDKTYKNPVSAKNMKRLAACVGKFSNSAVKNKVYELIRCNDKSLISRCRLSINVHAKYEIYTEDMFELVSLDCVLPFLHSTQVDHPEEYDGASSSS